MREDGARWQRTVRRVQLYLSTSPYVSHLSSRPYTLLYNSPTSPSALYRSSLHTQQCPSFLAHCTVWRSSAYCVLCIQQYTCMYGGHGCTAQVAQKTNTQTLILGAFYRASAQERINDRHFAFVVKRKHWAIIFSCWE